MDTKNYQTLCLCLIHNNLKTFLNVKDVMLKNKLHTSCWTHDAYLFVGNWQYHTCIGVILCQEISQSVIISVYMLSSL